MGTTPQPHDESMGLEFVCQFGIPAMTIDTSGSTPVISDVNDVFCGEFDVPKSIIGESPQQVSETYSGVPALTVAEHKSIGNTEIDLLGIGSTTYLRTRGVNTKRNLVCDIYFGGDGEIPHQQHLMVMHRVFRHDLRNGINTIRGWTNVLDDVVGEEPDVAQEAVSHIIQRVENLRRVSNEAGQLSRLMKFGTDHKQLDLRVLIDQVVEECETRFEDPDIDVSICPDAAVVGNKQLQLAIDNIVDNAIRHNPDNTTVTIDVTQDGEWVNLVISDDGEGIPSVERDLILGDQEVDQLNHSSGLGLWLAKWILEQHNAQLDILTVDVPGTTVDIRLPAATSSR